MAADACPSTIDLRELPPHHITGVDVTTDGYVIACNCGWRSDRVSRRAAVVAWSDHDATAERLAV